jgi:hypothetical protein
MTLADFNKNYNLSYTQDLIEDLTGEIFYILRPTGILSDIRKLEKNKALEIAKATLLESNVSDENIIEEFALLLIEELGNSYKESIDE